MASLCTVWAAVPTLLFDLSSTAIGGVQAPEGMPDKEGMKLLDMDAPVDGTSSKNANSIMRENDDMDNKTTNGGPVLRLARAVAQVGKRWKTSSSALLAFRQQALQPVGFPQQWWQCPGRTSLLQTTEWGQGTLETWSGTAWILFWTVKIFQWNDYEFAQLKGDSDPFVEKIEDDK